MPIENTNIDFDNAHLHDYVFHYNIFIRKWAAIPRDLYLEYWSNAEGDVKGVLKSSSIETLLSLLHKTKGNESKIDELIKDSDEKTENEK